MDHPPGYDRFRDGFGQAVDGRFYTIDYLDWLVRTGRARFTAGHDEYGRPLSAIVTKLRDYPGCRAIHGLVAAAAPGAEQGAALAQIAGRLIPEAEAWGRSRGCTHAIVESRAGWQRALRDQGYSLHQIALVKGL
jgi:hypothetical protein